MKTAVLDLGTNTFHLLIASDAKYPFEILYKERKYIFLAEYGIATIHDIPMQRAKNAIVEFGKILEREKPDTIRVLGTEALRKASNGQKLKDFVQKTIGHMVETISGQQEAHYITRGIALSIGDENRNQLAMDIGGGSTEFILSVHNQIIFSKSYPLGIMVLTNDFQNHDPISEIDIKALNEHLSSELSDLFSKAKDYSDVVLIGASGTFEVLLQLQGIALDYPSGKSALLPVDSVSRAIQQFVGLTHAERLKVKELPPERARLIVIALLLIQKIINELDITSIEVSPYALKEGILAEEFEIK